MSRSTEGRLLLRMGSVPEVAMRIALWRELFGTSIDETLQVVIELFVALDQRHPFAQVAYLSLLQFVEHPENAAASATLRQIAREAGAHRVEELVGGVGAARSPDNAELRSVPIDKERDVTLGERRSMARTSCRDRLDRLLFDLDPTVVENLMSNPRITEQDVVRMAARRPAPPEILRRIFRHPRWGRSREIRRALVQNPYLPTDVAAGLLAVLDRVSIRMLSAEPSVHPLIRARAEALLDARPVEVSHQAAQAPPVWDIELED